MSFTDVDIKFGVVEAHSHHIFQMLTDHVKFPSIALNMHFSTYYFSVKLWHERPFLLGLTLLKLNHPPFLENEITMTLTRRTPSIHEREGWAPRTPTTPTCTASAATAAAWAARPAFTRPRPPSPTPPCLSTCEWERWAFHFHLFMEFILKLLSCSIVHSFLFFCRNQTALFGGNPRYENVPLIGRGSPPPSVRWAPQTKSFI